MKRNRFMARGKLGGCLLLGLAALTLASCARDGFDDETFSSGVTGVTLEAPKVDGITVTPSADGKSQTVTWKVVYGAGGYKVSLYDAAKREKPIVTDSVIDGCTVTLDRKEDTNYIFAIRAMGNEKAGNSESTVTEKAFNTFTPAYMSVPEGDLKEWFEAHPCPADSVGKALVYDLVPGGNYTLSGVLDFGANTVQLRSIDKAKPANVVLAADANFKTYAGLTLKSLNIDCAVAKDLIVLSKTPDASLQVKSGDYVIKAPIAITSCRIVNVTHRLVYDSDTKYALEQFQIINSVIQIDHQDVVLSFKKTIPINMTFQNSTVYSTSKTGKFFAQIHGTEPGKVTGYAGGSFNFLNSTFCNLAYSKQFINTNTLKGRASLKLYFTKSIFVDCGKGEIMNRLTNGTHNLTALQNTYWYNGAKANEKYDTDVLTTDPGFKDAAGGDFTVSGAEQLANRTGDPRWLPAAE
ncbi:MAG: DUF4957 domain-containing protein [Prevotella buccae]|uniref:DUF4992 family lipoprotein n=1 Tax=Segatella buccae TaxID=28126 RepID=UPI00242F198D|nr:DUF4992 family lipoprotein [Segatella buccae]MBS5896509.1 DUF4957 domain-containing protein [Segatella buccae]